MTKYVSTAMDPSRFGSSATVNGRVIMRTWSMHVAKCLELYEKLGRAARYQDTGELVHDDE